MSQALPAETTKPVRHRFYGIPLADILSILLGLWLFVAPWVLAPPARFVTAHALPNPLLLRIRLAIWEASWSNWIVGALIVVWIIALLWRRWRMQWLCAILGVVTFATPWFSHLIGPAELTGVPGSVLSGIVLLFYVIPGTGGLVWNDWLTGAAIVVVGLASLASPVTWRRRRRP